MVDPREPAFAGVRDAFRGAGKANPFSDSGNIHAFHNLLDAWGLPRETTPRVYHVHAPAAFFAELRKMTGGLDQVQVESINLILAAGQHLPAQHMAYVLATAWHEARFKPQAEWGKGIGRTYGKAGKYGQKQYGRGFVQLTWDANYERADKELRLDGALLANFDLALEPGTAARILVKGMEQGWFTGKRLADYIPATISPVFDQFREARRIVNGMDKAGTIATYAGQCLNALRYGDWR